MSHSVLSRHCLRVRLSKAFTRRLAFIAAAALLLNSTLDCLGASATPLGQVANAQMQRAARSASIDAQKQIQKMRQKLRGMAGTGGALVILPVVTGADRDTNQDDY